MSDSLRILHLSDTHLSGDDRLHYGVVDTLAALDRVLARAEELGRVDVVVASGDLSDDGSPESYRRLRSRLEPWAAERGAEVVYAMGNHDLPQGFEEVLGDRERVVTVRGLRVVTVDSTVAGAGYGRIDADRLGRLRDALAQPAPHGTVVVLHHPPAPPSTGLFERLQLVEPEQFLEVCAQADVRLILAGHFHHALITTAGARDIPVVVAPAVANTTDVLTPPGRERAVRGSGFAFIRMHATGAMRAHIVSAPAPDDGQTVYDLDQAAIDRIAADSGWPGAGYSGSQLWKKLGLKAGTTAQVLHPDAGWRIPLDGAPGPIEWLAPEESPAHVDLIVAFYRTAAQFSAELDALGERIRPAGMLWIAWPRKAAGHVSNLDENLIRAAAIDRGLVDVKVAAVDTDWSALKLVWRLGNR
ncbi:metallophosphoesterase [Leifsonia sp. NPDC058292]|uniref:metallophosphoesterase n=1 Tax=Leifsonia sp. NPDC058292 TaxID=3346428 RepID=UPI0036DE0033